MNDKINALRKRVNGLEKWLADEAPYIAADQKHLDANTPERAYWHYGYCAALKDALKVLEGEGEGECHP